MTTMTKLIDSVTAQLVLEGQEAGAPDGPGYRAALDAMTRVGETIRAAVVRIGMPSEVIGSVEKLVTMRCSDQIAGWHWKLSIKVPGVVSITLLELAKHLSKTSLPIAVVRPGHGKVVRPRVASRLAA